MFSFGVHPSQEISVVAADVRIRAVRDFRDEIMDATNAAARRAYLHARNEAPNRTGNLKRAISWSPARYRPGGAGGGGTWQATVSVDTIMAPQAIYLLEGTGVYGPKRREIFPAKSRYAANVITTRKSRQKGRKQGGAPRMAFFKNGEGPIFRHSVEGQPAQTEWWDDALEVARRVLAQRIRANS